MVTEDKLISNTIVSLIATGAFAFFVLSCSTLNLIAALYSTLSIIGIVICILGLIKMFGWYLGLIETIAASIVVGFSVEYIVFLVNYFFFVLSVFLVHLLLNPQFRYQILKSQIESHKYGNLYPWWSYYDIRRRSISSHGRNGILFQNGETTYFHYSFLTFMVFGILFLFTNGLWTNGKYWLYSLSSQENQRKVFKEMIIIIIMITKIIICII